MTITNHMLAGSVIALAINEPILVLPLAYASHFFMDALPHFGYPGGHNFSEAIKIASKHRLSYIVSVATTITVIGVLSFLVINSLWLALVCGFLAVIPDGLMLLNYVLFERKGYAPKGPRLYLYLNLQLHGKVQNERPEYLYVEVLVFIMLLATLIKLI
jgi:hypothetical protein